MDRLSIVTSLNFVASNLIPLATTVLCYSVYVRFFLEMYTVD